MKVLEQRNSAAGTIGLATVSMGWMGRYPRK